ncbi:MAG: hypothetical protein A2Y73_04355 [Chloroflexi bacterium RBG_13_56_8]|nr:MAG: hypothetical protein A2Y73_04355 [Chloroflexi bacterium RBG_13_56_8]
MSTNNSPILIRVDHRELASEVPQYLRELDSVRIEIEQLEAADYILGPQTAVERKSVGDFLVSILDKRLFSQIEALTVTFDQVIYLIEGESLYSAGNLHPNAVRGALSYLVILNGVTLLRSEGPEDSALLLATMARHAQHGLGYEISTHHKRRTISPQLQMRYLVEDLPDIGAKTAQALLERFGTLRALFSASEAELRQVPGIGEKRASEIHELANRSYGK